MKLDAPSFQHYSRCMTHLYERFSNQDTFVDIKSNGILDEHQKRIFDHYGLEKPANSFTLPFFEATSHSPNNKVMVGFSGGKDSLAVALKLLAEGKEVYPFFLKGINKSYTTEEAKFQELVKKLGLEGNAIVRKVKQDGKSGFFENPFKNGVILTQMIEAGQPDQISEYVLGNQLEDNYDNCEVLYELSDAIEFFDMMQKLIPFVKIRTLLQNDADSFETIYKFKPELLDHVGSCIMPVFRRPNIRKANQAKYGFQGDGCGSCYKCSMEYLFKSAKGLIQPVPAYTAHCKKVLEKKLIKFDY